MIVRGPSKGEKNETTEVPKSNDPLDLGNECNQGAGTENVESTTSAACGSVAESTAQSDVAIGSQLTGDILYSI